MAEPTDGEFVGRTREGDREAYGTLVARYQGHVYGLAYSLAGNWADAQDIAQETFIRAYVNLDQLRDPARFAPWLRRVTFGVAMNWLKAFRPGFFQQIEGQVDLDSLEIPDFAPGPAEALAKRELAEAVQRAIASLPPKYRVPLTMFHLDGLSYLKVAQFLDIPLGTVQSLIHRARQKLRVALTAYAAEEVSPMVQEVFNEHKLPAEFAQKVLANVPDLRWDKGECTFPGAVTACMEYLKEDVGYDFVMGVSGGAFKLLWTWCPSCGDLLLVGDEVVRRTFWALGRAYQRVQRSEQEDQRESFRRLVVESIDAGRPVIASGVVGPPESCVITGYEQSGDVLLGQSYFHDGSQGYYRKPDWYNDCWGLILVGEKRQPPAAREILSESLAWAVELARVPRRGWSDNYMSGLAAYDAWAQALQRDESFPRGDLETLTMRCNVSNSVVLTGLRDARQSAARFINGLADVEPGAAPHLLAAARTYGEECHLLDRAVETAPSCFGPEEDRLRMADGDLRSRLAGLIREAMRKDEQAVDHMDKALQAIKT